MLAHSPRPASLSPGSRPPQQEEGKKPDVQANLEGCVSTLETVRGALCATVPFLLQQHHDPPSAFRDLPLNLRTPTMNLLVFLTQMQDTNEKMRTWAEALLIELRSQESVDTGAIVGQPLTRMGWIRANLFFTL